MDHQIYSTNSEYSFFGHWNQTILVHNGDGLEPILSFCNAIILKRNLVLEGDISEEWEVLSFLRDRLEEFCPDQLKDRIEDAVSSLLQNSPKPAWNSIISFKTNECSEILKVLKIPLYHGWVIEDKNAEAKCHDEVMLSACSDLERTMVNVSGGMTEYGLFCLKKAMENHEVCVLVHNNTFRTATKYEDEVYLLVTNKGLINGGMFWEKLTDSVMKDKVVEVADEALDTQMDGANGIAENIGYSTTSEFSFFGHWNQTILVHNGDGLEPILSICNAIILKCNLVLEGDFSEEWEVLSFLRDRLEEFCPDQLKDRIEDAVSSLLQNSAKPAWNSIGSFKINECSEILKVLKIPLYYGWVIEDKNAEAKCDNEVMLSACSDIERTMVNVKGGMTEYALYCLKEAMENHEVCVIVHNNTFRTATKYEDEVYLLVTNKGLIKGGMFWEKLNSSEERGAEVFDWEEDYYGAPDMGGGAEAFDWEGDNNGAEDVEEEAFDYYGAEDIEGAEEFDSGDSMETHAGGKASPKSILQVLTSSSSTDDLSS